jgi:PKD repeat protein
VAAFSFGPRSPVEGQAVTFEDRSAGPSETRTWDFGDAASGASNVSTTETPSHAYSKAGVYTVRLTVANEGGTSTRTRDVTVTASPGSRAATLPVAGHVVGAAGATFITDVAVENPSAEAVSATLVFSPSGGETPLEAPISLAPGETRLLADVVESVFGTSNALGSLRVETEGAPPAALRVAGRTYVEEAGSTLGLGAIGLPSSEAATGDRYLSNLAISESFRTNIGAVNTSEADQTFALHLLDRLGNTLGRTLQTLAPGQQRQWSLVQLFPSASGSGLTARIVPSGGGLAPLTYAAVTDNDSSDPTYYPALGPSPVQYVPGIASVTGVGDAFFRSEVSIANSGRGAATVRLTFLERDRNNATAPTATFVLGPYETLHADDALLTLFGVTDTYGALLVESDVSPGVAVFERILTDASTTPGTVGQQTDAVSAETLAPRGSVLGIRQDTDFRTNIGIVNPGTTSATVTLTLVRSPTTVLDVAEVVVPARGYVQRNLAALFPGAALPPAEVLSVAYDASSQPVLAFASVIDNVSQDPTFYPAQP